MDINEIKLKAFTYGRENRRFRTLTGFEEALDMVIQDMKHQTTTQKDKQCISHAILKDIMNQVELIVGTGHSLSRREKIYIDLKRKYKFLFSE